MWLVILAYTAIIATLLWYKHAENDTYLFKYLALISWGATIMFFIDHVYRYLTEGGEFIDTSPDAILLGIVLNLITLGLWTLILLIKDPKRVIRAK